MDEVYRYGLRVLDEQAILSLRNSRYCSCYSDHNLTCRAATSTAVHTTCYCFQHHYIHYCIDCHFDYYFCHLG